MGSKNLLLRNTKQDGATELCGSKTGQRTTTKWMPAQNRASIHLAERCRKLRALRKYYSPGKKGKNMSDWSLQCDVWLSRSGTPENPSPRMAFAAGWNARDVICDTIECPDCGTEFSVDCDATNALCKWGIGCVANSTSSADVGVNCLVSLHCSFAGLGMENKYAG